MTGRWTDQVTALSGVSIPMTPTLGLLVVSKPVPTTLRSLAHTPTVNVRPDGGSRVIMASFEHDRRLEQASPRETLREYAAEILERAAAILPALEGSGVESYTLGIRAIPRDGFPVIGPVSGVEAVYVIATRSGVTMGPLLGRLAAQEILSGAVDDRIVAFRPVRPVSADAVGNGMTAG